MHGIENVRLGNKKVRHGAQNVQYGAKNVRHGANNFQHGAKYVWHGAKNRQTNTHACRPTHQYQESVRPKGRGN